MTNIRAKTRVGFTLVELLVVISIIAILAALSTSAYFRVRAGQESSATEATLTKLNTGLDRRWRAVIDQAAEDAGAGRKGKSPQFLTIENYVGGNTDLARTVWTYMLLKNEFPTTFKEAITPVNFGGVTLQPRNVFSQLPASGGSDALESAACFYLSLTATGNRGETFMSDGTNNQTKEIELGGKKVNVFVDAWGKPIAFSRMSYSTEIDGLTNNPTLKDPLDQTPGTSGSVGQLQSPTATWNAARLDGFWNIIKANHIAGGNIPATYTNKNWVATLISAGPNEDLGTTATDLPAPIGSATPGLLGSNDNGADNVLSFRLRKEGARGD